MMRYFNRTENPNAVAGIFLLIMLAVFAGPNTLPRLLSSTFSFVDEGVPCQWLRQGTDRAAQQSLIGRAASSLLDPPIRLNVETSSVTSDPNGRLTVSITVINQTIGTIPFLLTPDSVIVGAGTGESGLGIVFNSTAAIPPAAAGTTSYPESQIRLLGPRQRCVHRVAFPFNQLDPNVGLGNATIRAYYRNGSRGTAAANPGVSAVYSDQGLWVGVVESAPFTIPVSAQ